MTPGEVNGFLKMPVRDSAAPRSAPALRWCDKAGKQVYIGMAQHCRCKCCAPLHFDAWRRAG